jgi:hypothetical protein
MSSSATPEQDPTSATQSKSAKKREKEKNRRQRELAELEQKIQDGIAQRLQEMGRSASGGVTMACSTCGDGKVHDVCVHWEQT